MNPGDLVGATGSSTPWSARTIPLGEDDEIRVNTFCPQADLPIFHTREFFELHGREGDRYYQLCRKGSPSALATIIFHQDGENHWVSPRRGTFGGLAVAETLLWDRLFEFLKATLADLGETPTVRLVQAPAAHNQDHFSTAVHLFGHLGMKASVTDLNFALAVLPGSLEDRMDYGNRKRLKKCRAAGFVGEALAPELHKEAYDLIAANRHRRGYPMTMTWEQILQNRETFPDRMMFYGVRTPSGVLAAASICIVVSQKVCYVFYWGDAEEMQTYSPTTFLATYLHETVREEGFQLLDLGLSTEAGQPNSGLIVYKRRLGAEASLRLTFELTP